MMFDGFRSRTRAKAFSPARACAGVLLVVLSPSVLQAQTASPVRQAEALIQRGQTAAAIEILRRESTRTPSVRATYLLGFALMQEFNYREAETWLRDAVLRAPGLPEYRHALAKSLLEQGKNLAAIKELDRAIAIEQKPEFHFARAMCALNVADFPQARIDLETTLALAENSAEAWFQLGKLKVNEGHYEGGKQDLRRALALQPDHLEARFYLGLSQKHGGEPEAAMAAFNMVLEQVPGHVGALLNLGKLQMRSGDREEGKQTLERFSKMSALRDDIEFHQHAVKKNPDNVNGRLALAQKQLEIGNHADATAQLLAARQLQPGNPRIYFLLAEALRRQGRQAQAEQAENYARQLQARARQQGPQQ